MNDLERRPESFPSRLPAPRRVKTRGISAGGAHLPPGLGLAPTALRVRRHRRKRDFGHSNPLRKQSLFHRDCSRAASTLPVCRDGDSARPAPLLTRQAAFRGIRTQQRTSNLRERDFISCISEMLLKSTELEPSPSPVPAVTSRQ